MWIVSVVSHILSYPLHSMSHQRAAVTPLRIPAMTSVIPPEFLQSLDAADHDVLHDLWKLLYEYACLSKVIVDPAHSNGKEIPPGIVTYKDDDLQQFGVTFYYPPHVKEIGSERTGAVNVLGKDHRRCFSMPMVTTGSEMIDGHLRPFIKVRIWMARSKVHVEYKAHMIFEEIQSEVVPVSVFADDPDGIGVHKHVGQMTSWNNVNSPRTQRKLNNKRREDVAAAAMRRQQRNNLVDPYPSGGGGRGGTLVYDVQSGKSSTRSSPAVHDLLGGEEGDDAYNEDE